MTAPCAWSLLLWRQVTELIEELDVAGCEALGLRPDTGTVPRLLAYARSVAGFPTAVKEVRRAASTLRDSSAAPSTGAPRSSAVLPPRPAVEAARSEE